MCNIFNYLVTEKLCSSFERWKYNYYGRHESFYYFLTRNVVPRLNNLISILVEQHNFDPHMYNNIHITLQHYFPNFQVQSLFFFFERNQVQSLYIHK